jgi:hypothetical protein
MDITVYKTQSSSNATADGNAVITALQDVDNNNNNNNSDIMTKDFRWFVVRLSGGL